MSAGAAAGERVVEGRAEAGRFDVAVAKVAGISRAHAQRLIGDGRARLDGRRARASDRLQGGEQLSVELSAPATIEASSSLVPMRRKIGANNITLNQIPPVERCTHTMPQKP